jgi:hypothetical protein
MRQHTSAWTVFGPVVLALLVIVAVGLWAKSAVLASKPETVGMAAPIEASAVAPMELMISRGHALPIADYVEPF